MRSARRATARLWVTSNRLLRSSLRQRDHQLQHLFPGSLIQIAGRFIRQHQGRTVHQGACDGDPLLLTSGELVGIGGTALAQIHGFQHLLDLVVHLPLWIAVQLQRQGDVLRGGEGGYQIEELVDKTDPAAPEQGQGRFLQLG